MKILVTGADGQVGRALVRLLAQRSIELAVADTADADLCRDSVVAGLLEQHRPDYLVNCAAYGDVDAAEQDRDGCFRINRDVPAMLASHCARRDLPLVQLSSELVFDGAKASPYLETDTPRPLSVYGESQWAGEQAVRAAQPHHLVLRSSWVFGPDGDNFLTRTLRQASEYRDLAVVNDRFGCPTPAADLARVILAMLEQVDCKVDPPLWGTYHYVGSDRTDWHTFAEAIIKAAKSYLDVRVESVEAVASEPRPAAAPRPVNAELGARRVLATFGIKQQPWRRGIQEALRTLYEPRGETSQ